MTGRTFSRDEVLGYLKEFPDLIDSVMKNEDGTFTFKLDNIEVEWDKSNDDLANQIQAKIDNAKKANVKEYFKSNAEYQAAFAEASSGFRNSKDADAFNEEYFKKYFAEHKDEYDKYIQDQENSLKPLSDLLGSTNGEIATQAENLKLLDERCKNYVDEISNLNAPIKTVQEAIDAMNAGQALTYDQMVELLQISPKLSDSVTKQGDGYYIVVDSLINLREESYKTRNEYIDNLIAMQKAEIEAAEATQRVIATKINSYASSLIYMKEIAEIESEIASKEGIIAILEQMKNGLANPSGSGSGSGTGGISDILQQQIDRYEVLLNAIEIVANKRIELLEAEKEALQDKNDEEQRELDLIEAKNNLDKAKKMKTIVYEKGKGFVQVENKKAISDAQKEYDDAVLEKRTAEIDKQIENLEDYVKPFTEMKSDIEDAITVEQAKKALKTDENGLLSLDEKTAKNIRDGLAEAVLKKDKQDNSGNPYYQDVTLDYLLKRLGATVTGEQAKAILYEPLKNMKLPQTNMQAFNSNTTNNSYVNNTSSSNRNVSLNSTFNIYDASDPVKIRNEIDGYFRDIAREIK